MTDAEKENKEKKPRRSRKDVVNYDLTGVIEAASQALRKATGLWEQALEAHRQALEALMQSEEWPKLQEIFPDITEEEGLFVAFLSKDLIEYAPEILQQKKAYEIQTGESLSFSDLLNIAADDEKEIVLLEQFLYEAQRIRDSIPRNIQAKRIKKTLFPNDKLTHDLYGFELPRAGDQSGQQMFSVFDPKQFNSYNSQPLKMSRGKNGKGPATVYYSYHYDLNYLKKMGLTLSKETYFDLWVQNAIANLWEQGNREVTLSQIYNAMPGKKKNNPGTNQLNPILKSLLRQQAITLYVNTLEISQEWGLDPNSKYYYEIVDSLLPIRVINERIRVNGKLTNTYVVLRDLPPLIGFSKYIGQCRTLPLEVLDVDLTRNNTDYSVYDYLLRNIERIANKYKAGTLGEEKLLYSSLFETLGITDERQKNKRTAVTKTALSLLSQFRDKGYIANYREAPKGEERGVYITKEGTRTHGRKAKGD